jgi:hypothetical protein
MRIAIAAALAAAFLAASAAQAFVPANKSVKDWDAVCDNTGACAAFGFTPDDGATPAFVRVTRAAGPAAAPAVEIAYDSGDTQPASQQWTLAVDGKALPGVGTLTARGGDDGARVTLTAPQAAALIDAIRGGQHLDLMQAGKSLATISLAGSAAILLWVDADQGRAGTVTALVGQGAGPASSAPPPAPIPLVAAAAPVSQARLPKLAPPSLIKGNRDCTMDVNPVSPPDDIVARLAPGVVLWGPECEMAAYNEVNVFFLGDEHGGHIQPLKLPDYAGFTASSAGAVELVNAEFDPKTQTLSAFDKGRGIGDCGSTASWVWDGKAFQLLGETLMSDCHMVMTDDWPTLYVARQR